MRETQGAHVVDRNESRRTGTGGNELRKNRNALKRTDIARAEPSQTRTDKTSQPDLTQLCFTEMREIIMKQKLDRTLGMYSALMISIGTMIGSAIFVLAGTSYATAGPGASLAIFLAGIAAVFTGLSFAELVTVVPKAGGGYVYVKEATGNNITSIVQSSPEIISPTVMLSIF